MGDPMLPLCLLFLLVPALSLPAPDPKNIHIHLYGIKVAGAAKHGANGGRSVARKDESVMYHITDLDLEMDSVWAWEMVLDLVCSNLMDTEEEAIMYWEEGQLWEEEQTL